MRFSSLKAFWWVGYFSIGSLFLFSPLVLLAHNMSNASPHVWELKDGTKVVGVYQFVRNDSAIIQLTEGRNVGIWIESFQNVDQECFRQIDHKKRILSETPVARQHHPKNVVRASSVFGGWLLAMLFLIGAVLLMLRSFLAFNNRFLLAMLLALVSLCSFSVVYVSNYLNTPQDIDAAFVPFKPQINTYWSSDYFYVESLGIPTTHPMMVGISNHGWQQQVPIPQCYIGNNAWPIPLNPVMASNPIPVDNVHFTRGAIAIAANGVPIFNYHTNTGVDSYLDGQLDNFGGHCGMADDYHYHIAPLHLYQYTTHNLPIAYGLDGFPVFGSVEPDGSDMQALDANHGHYFNGEYHYHGTTEAPYMIGRMAGEVTEDATHQLIPQAASTPVRPGLTPLNGALITSCTEHDDHSGYTLVYQLAGQTDSIVYHWTSNGIYTYQFYNNGNGTFTSQTYNGFAPCQVSADVEQIHSSDPIWRIQKNPIVNNQLILVKSGGWNVKQVSSMKIYSSGGQLLWSSGAWMEIIPYHFSAKGVYILSIEINHRTEIERFVVL